MIIQETIKPPSHTLGQCVSDRNSKLIYVNIPKNASTWAKDYLSEVYGWDNGANFKSSPFLNKFHKIVILRDPVDRWLSAIMTYLVREVHYFNFNKDVVRILCTKINFDEHTWTQTKFLNGIDIKDCTFFMFDDKLKENLDNFLLFKKVNKINIEKEKSIFRNSLQELGVQNMKLELKKYLDSNIEYKKNIYEFYKDDFNLIKKVEFYQKQIIR